MFRLTKVRIQNFKCFEDIDVEIESQCTTLIGMNQSGKSSFLEAISYLSNDEEIPKKHWRKDQEKNVHLPRIEAWFQGDGKTWPEILEVKNPHLLGIVKPLRRLRIIKDVSSRSIDFLDEEKGEVLPDELLEKIEGDIKRKLWGSASPIDEYEKVLEQIKQDGLLVNFWETIDEIIPNKQVIPQDRETVIKSLDELKEQIEATLSKTIISEKAASDLIEPIDKLLQTINAHPGGGAVEHLMKNFQETIDKLEENGELLDESTFNNKNMEDPEDIETIIETVKAWWHKQKGALLKSLNYLLKSTRLKVSNVKDLAKKAITTIYFDEYTDRLPEDLPEKKALTNPMVNLLLEIAGRKQGVLKQDYSPDRVLEMEGASAHFTNQVSQYWTQESLIVKLVTDGNIFGIRVATILEDGKETRPQLPSELSKGMQWYLGFFTKFWGESDMGHKDAILLLDDVAVYLHPSGQKDLFNLFKKMGASNQIIYSTHFPYLVPPDLSKIRVCLNSGGKATIYNKYTQVPRDQHMDRADALAPIRASLGISLGDSMFSGDKTLIVEGITDMYYMEALSRYLKKYNKTNLESKELTILPAGDADRAVKWGLFHEKEDLPYFVLLDSGREGARQKNHAESTYKNFIKGKIELLHIMCNASKEDKIKDIESFIQLGFPEHAKNKHNVDESIRFGRFLDEQPDNFLLKEPDKQKFWKLCNSLFKAIKYRLDI